MKLTILGGGGFRVPLVYEAVCAPRSGLTIDEVALYDVDPGRLATIAAVIAGLDLPAAPELTLHTDLDTAVSGSGFVFCAVRVGGTDGRTVDERAAMRHGLLGQETVGPGGLAYALRTLPEMLRIAERIRVMAPEAWTINFTNPAGIVTEAMSAVLGNRVVGICDTPIGLLRRAALALSAEPSRIGFDYVGLNHLGWLRSLTVGGTERLGALLHDDDALAGIEEARVLGFDWIRALGVLPNEYLYYYYFQREATASIAAAGQTRGEFIRNQQTEFYAGGTSDALRRWRDALHARESTYMAEARRDSDARLESDVTGGGYQQVAVDLMTAIATGRPATMILNVANSGTIPELPDDAVIEVGCTVDSNGAHPRTVAPVQPEFLGLMLQVKSVEQLIIAAVREHSFALAWKAFALHPLVDSAAEARMLLERYMKELPGVAAALDA